MEVIDIGGLSRLSAKCQSCKYMESCNHKEMEALAYIDDEQFSQGFSSPIVQTMLREPEIINTSVISTGILTQNPGSISIDKKLIEDEINKALHKDLFMQLC